MKPKTEKQEVGKMLKEYVDGTASALEEMLKPVELPPEIGDDQIKQAILEITPDGYERMMQRLEAKGVSRQEVISFLDTFMQGRKF